MKGDFEFNGEGCWHKRHRDWDYVDRITMEIVERYKTSGLSGDEWRFNIWIRFWFKGEVVHEFTSRNMQYAMMLVGQEYLHNGSPIPKRVVELDDKLCDQPGCAEVPVARLVLKRETDDAGSYLDPAELYGRHYRKFCKKHVRRGDCGREDADTNYIPVDGVSAEDSTNTEESPSSFGGVIVVGDTKE